jgi:hypothetical protein
VRDAYRILVGKPERKRPLGIHRRKLEDGIKMDLRDIGYGGLDWIVILLRLGPSGGLL